MQDTQQNKTWQERHKWYESKTGQMQRVVELTHNGSKYHQLVPSQYKGGGSTVKGFRGCGFGPFGSGEKRGYFEIPAETSFGKRPCWDGISPKKRQVKDCDHSMHAIGIGKERASNLYPFR